MRGEAVAGAAEGLDDIGVADGPELAAEGADTWGNDVAFRRYRLLQVVWRRPKDLEIPHFLRYENRRALENKG